MKKLAALLACFAILAPSLVFAQTHTTPTDFSSAPVERILSYKSDITVQTDRTLAVNEEITAYADGATIKHGIYRDFPTDYTGSLGNHYKVTFTFGTVEMNGASEPYHTASMSNGIRVYIGDPDILLNPGAYTYNISYTVTRELGFFKDHDELYWNVTGNGWDYQIDSAQATVHLPAAIPLTSITTDGYTGAFGSKDKNFTASTTADGISFMTTGILAPNEGLTIVVGWPKGYIVPPTALETVTDFFKDNSVYLFEVLFLLTLLCTYFAIWFKHGRDPKPGTIVAQYDAPQGLSPAALRYMYNEKYDTKALTASLIHLAIQGCIRISEKAKLLVSKSYTLTRTGTGTGTDDEAQVLSAIFLGDETTFEPSSSNYVPLLQASTDQKAFLKAKFKDTFFTSNTKYYIKIAGWFVIVACAFFYILITFLDSNQLTAFPFIAAVLIINTVFIFMMRQRTPEGRVLQDNIEGFKLFLSVTEKDRMNFANPPQQTPELFEKFLPYALALGVENKWAEQFASTFAALEQSGHAYVPLWYVGNSFSSANIGGFASSLGSSFSSTISSSSVPPGSSSGGGGGGSSGGGGGGGGGGGW